MQLRTITTLTCNCILATAGLTPMPLPPVEKPSPNSRSRPEPTGHRHGLPQRQGRHDQIRSPLHARPQDLRRARPLRQGLAHRSQRGHLLRHPGATSRSAAPRSRQAATPSTLCPTPPAGSSSSTSRPVNGELSTTSQWISPASRWSPNLSPHPRRRCQSRLKTQSGNVTELHIRWETTNQYIAVIAQ